MPPRNKQPSIASSSHEERRLLHLLLWLPRQPKPKRSGHNAQWSSPANPPSAAKASQPAAYGSRNTVSGSASKLTALSPGWPHPTATPSIACHPLPAPASPMPGCLNNFPIQSSRPPCLTWRATALSIQPPSRLNSPQATTGSSRQTAPVSLRLCEDRRLCPSRIPIPSSHREVAPADLRATVHHLGPR